MHKLSRQLRRNPLISKWLLEVLFYIYLFIGAFAHLVLYIPNAAPALLSLTTIIAILKSPLRLKWVILPFLAIVTMSIIDFIGYAIGVDTIKYYLFGTMVFAICLVLHEDLKFFDRAKLVLLIYLFCHLLFLDPSIVDESRIGLSEDLQLTMANSNDLAYWCGFGIFVSLVATTKIQMFKRCLYLGVAFTCGIVLLKTVSRSGLLLTGISVLIYLVLAIRNRHRVLNILTFLSVVVCSLLVYYSDIINKYQERMEYEEKVDYTFSNRTLYLQEGIKVFLESPWIGTGQDNVNPPGANKLSAPHNAFISIAVHYGIWPTVFFLILWFIALVKSMLLVIRSKEWLLGDLPYELFAFTIFLFLMSNMSNLMMLAPFSILYMTKVLTTQSNKIANQ
jgi:hypothetical protein